MDCHRNGVGGVACWHGELRIVDASHAFACMRAVNSSIQYGERAAGVPPYSLGEGSLHGGGA